MKHIRIMTLFFAAIISPVLPHMHAQKFVIKAEVPFGFAVGNKTLPAGEYLIVREGSFLHFQNRTTNSGLFVIPQWSGQVEAGRGPKLLFQQLNGSYFLKSIVATTSANSVVFSSSRLEKEAEELEHRTYAANFAR